MNRSLLIIGNGSSHSLYRGLLSNGVKVIYKSFDEILGNISKVMSDVVIIDCNSNDDTEKGLDLLQLIKSGHPGIPVIFITTHSSVDVVIRAYKTGARAFFKSPLKLHEFRSTLQGLLNLRRLSYEKRLPYGTSSDNDDEIRMSVSPNLRRTVTYILDTLAERHSLAELAERSNMSKYHFCRSFHRYCGISPMKFISEMRVKKAIDLLRSEDVTIAMLSDKLGYSDTGSFIRQFKRLTGRTPAAYKTMMRGENI